MTNAPHPTQSTIGSSTGTKPVVTKLTHDNKEVKILAAIVAMLATVIAGYWVYSEQSRTGIGNGQSENAVSAAASLSGLAVPVSTIPDQPQALLKTEALRADVYFDFGRSRLSHEANTILQEQAEILKNQSNWALLLQGYTDQRGPAEYNKALGLRRAEAVKQHLVELGLPDTSIKVMSSGKEGLICEEDSKECRQRNRRVHLELVKGVAQKPQPAPVFATKEEEHLETSEHADDVSDKVDQIVSRDSETSSSPSQ